MNHSWSESRNMIFSPCVYCVVRSGCSAKWPRSAMRGASSSGNRIANAVEAERRRAAMRGASLGGGTATIRDRSRGGGLRWVRE